MTLTLRYEDRPVATLDEQAVALAYHPDWLAAPDRFPLSLTMPLGEGPFGPERALPWLANLLPEGEPLRAMTRVLGAAAEDVLGLIAATGGDLAGALSIDDQAPAGPPGYRAIAGPAALERMIAELPARPFLADEEGVTMSLAGAQDKLPVALHADGLAIPINGAPSTHILKPDNPRLHGSVQNEALCMVLARRTGLETAAVTTGVAGERAYLLVERYDRATGGDAIRRIHQEDFCQALGRPPAAKYEFNRTGGRGVSLAQMIAVTRTHMTARDTTRLLDAFIFNIAIGNVDSHAKNYSILLPHEVPSLAPLYDLMTGLAWDGITPNHAQAIGGQRRGRHIYGRHWERMAAACGLAPRGTIRRVEAVTARLLRELPAAAAEVTAMPAGSGPMLDLFRDTIAQRASEVRAHAQVSGDDEGEPPSLGNAPDPSVKATAYSS